MSGQIQYGDRKPLTSAPTPAARTQAQEARAAEEEKTFIERIAREGLPVVASTAPLGSGESCHFATPVRFGRRRSDQIGYVELTSGRLLFHGALDMSIAWDKLSSVTRDGRDIVASLADSARDLRFCCHSHEEAARGAAIARRLRSAAAV